MKKSFIEGGYVTIEEQQSSSPEEKFVKKMLASFRAWCEKEPEDKVEQKQSIIYYQPPDGQASVGIHDDKPSLSVGDKIKRYDELQFKKIVLSSGKKMLFENIKKLTAGLIENSKEFQNLFPIWQIDYKDEQFTFIVKFKTVTTRAAIEDAIKSCEIQLEELATEIQTETEQKKTDNSCVIC